MRVAILADPFGNGPAFDAVVDALDVLEPDRVFVLDADPAAGPSTRKITRAIERRGFTYACALTAAKEPASHSMSGILRETLAGTRVLLASGSTSVTPMLTCATPSTETLARLFEQGSADAIVMHDADAPLVTSLGERLFVRPGRVGRPNAGDPRALIAVLELAEDRAPRASLIRIPYPAAKNLRAVKRAVARGRLSREAGDAHLTALIDLEPHASLPLQSNLSSHNLSIALLSPRIYRVYARALSVWPEDDVEHVHDLRVAARRLREALAIAEPILPRRRTARARRRARKLGRALGRLRMLDVFIDDLKRNRPKRSDDLGRFIAMLGTRRAEAKRRLDARFPREKLLRHGLELVELSMSAKSSLTLFALAVPHISARADAVEARLPSMDDPNAAQAQHALRIALKHLRYALETVAPAFPDIIDPAVEIPPIRALQDALGRLNDERELFALIETHDRADALSREVRAAEGASAHRFPATRALVATEGPRIVARARTLATTLGVASSNAGRLF